MSNVLEKLNEDVLLNLMRFLPPKDLRSFSLACHWFREAAMPLRYGHVRFTLLGPAILSDPDKFLPASIRPHVRSMLLYDRCYIYWPENLTSGLCDMFYELGDRLREVPHVSSLVLLSDVPREEHCHGLPWSALCSALSVPHLRAFTLRNITLCPVLGPGEELRVESLASITFFHYQLNHPRESRPYPTEIDALSVVLEKLCETLETLALVSESAPLSVMEHLPWPRLRKMVFYGSPMFGPFIRACFGMQHLRHLSLKLNPAWGAMPQPVWPTGYDGEFPWPELERLTISYPDPRDEIYDHLPSTLSSLSLRCWYHQHFQTYLAFEVGTIDRPFGSTLLSSSTLSSILCRCSMLKLAHLEIEYSADDQDDALLHYIATTFPHLEGLKIHRYRSAVFSVQARAPVHIARLLAPLTKLRRLKVFLDWGDCMDKTFDHVLDAANVFANTLSPSLHMISIHSVGATWRIFTVAGGSVLEQHDIK